MRHGHWTYLPSVCSSLLADSGTCVQAPSILSFLPTAECLSPYYHGTDATSQTHPGLGRRSKACSIPVSHTDARAGLGLRLGLPKTRKPSLARAAQPMQADSKNTRKLCFCLFLTPKISQDVLICFYNRKGPQEADRAFPAHLTIILTVSCNLAVLTPHTPKALLTG